MLELVKYEHRPQFRRATSSKPDIIGTVTYHMISKEKPARVFIGLLCKLAVPVLVVTSLIHKFFRGFFPKKRKVMQHNFPPAPTSFFAKELSKDNESRDQEEFSNKTNLILAISNNKMLRTVILVGHHNVQVLLGNTGARGNKKMYASRSHHNQRLKITKPLSPPFKSSMSFYPALS